MGPEPNVDSLVSVTSAVATKGELHTHVVEGTIVRMRQVKAIEVHPGTPTVLKPGGLHIMLIGLNKPLKEGDSVPLQLTFERAGTIEVEATVKSLGHAEQAKPGQGGHKKPTH
jgi:copper(I)-binding protein